MQKAVRRVIGWCLAQDWGRKYVYQFWDDGLITRSVAGEAAYGYEPVQEVTGQILRWGGEVPDEVRRDGAEA